MKTRLSLIVSFLLAALLASGSALAQKPQGKRDFFGGPPSAEEHLLRLSEALDLSDEQSVSLLTVLHEKEARRAALHERAIELIGADVCALRAETESDILAILTPEQGEQFLQSMEQRRVRAGERDRQRSRRGSLDCSQYGDG